MFILPDEGVNNLERVESRIEFSAHNYPLKLIDKGSGRNSSMIIPPSTRHKVVSTTLPRELT